MNPDRELRDPNDLLEDVKARGEQLRRRRLTGRTGAVALAFLLLVMVIWWPRSGEHKRLNTLAETSTTTTSTSTLPPSTSVATEESTGVGTVPSTSEPLVCRNSHDPACGPLVWDPPPLNQPGHIEVTEVEPVVDEGGYHPRFRIVYSDPDSGPVSCAYVSDTSSTDGVSDGRDLCLLSHRNSHPDCLDKFGPWDPAPNPTSRDFILEWGGFTPGPHTVVVTVELSRSGSVYGSAPCDPYSESLQAELTINVPEPPPTSIASS